jgi:hypothetical protein
VGSHIDLIDPVTSQPDYPAAIEILGVRMLLERETRFSRFYSQSYLPHPSSHFVSRFVDGSAPIMTLETLKAEWTRWSEEDRIDFCAQCECLSYVESDIPDEKPDLPAMVRFVIEHGSPGIWNSIADPATRFLPRDEVYERMVIALKHSQIGKVANLLNAIAQTKEPGADKILREQLQRAWDHPLLWQASTAYNAIASQAVHCIALLIKDYEASPLEFENKVRQLSNHACVRNQKNCSRTLWRYFGWRSAAADQAFENKTGGLPPEDRPT